MIKTWTKEQCKAALPITEAELISLGISKEDIEKGESRGKLNTQGVWRIPVNFSALAMSTVYTPKEQQRYSAEMESQTAYGMRSMYNVRQGGYELEGWVSINGKKYTAFTSSQLFELENGKLVDVAVIHVRIR